MAQHNIIELNGRQYDAATGALLGESLIHATPRSRADLMPHHGRAIDGVIRGSNARSSLAKASPKSAASHVNTSAQTQAQPKTNAIGPKQMDIKRAAGISVKPHQPQRPKTLMRSVVTKPKAELKPNIKTTTPSEMIAKPASSLAKPLEKKMSVTQVDPLRLSRAKHIPKSHHIRRFGAQHAGATETLQSTQQLTPVQRPSQYANRPLVSRPNAVHTAQTTTSAAAQPAVQAQQQAPREKVDIFEAALAHATSHEQVTPKDAHKHSLRHRRIVSVLAGVAAFLVIGGFVGYLNMANIEIRVASAQAGFHAELPGYKPTGYALNGGIKTSDGKVAMSYKSGDSAYTITQEPSAWNSQTLLDQTTAEQGKPQQTIQSNGRTIYVYGSNATWVNGGILYHVNGTTNLTTDELTNLAISM